MHRALALQEAYAPPKKIMAENYRSREGRGEARIRSHRKNHQREKTYTSCLEAG